MMGQREMLRECMRFIMQFDEMKTIPPQEWAKTLWHAHQRGMLYVVPNKEHSRIKLILCAYRVPEWNEKVAENFPQEEKGDIAYCPFALSDGSDKLMLLRAVKNYLKANPEVKDIYFYSHVSEDLKHFKRPEPILN